MVAAVAGLLTAAQFAATAHSSRAQADVATGSAGVFVPTQGTVLDTRSGVGGVSGPVAANSWYAVPVGGQAGVPSSGVSSVQVSVTVLTPAATGLVKLAPDGTTDVHIAALTYTGGGGSISASSIVALQADGKIGILATTSVSVLMHVQGYYTAGNGSPTPGGYVPVGPTRIVDTRYGTGLPQAKLATGSTTTIPVGGLAGVPSDASAVFVMLTAITTSSTGGYFSPYPTGTTRPANVSLNYLPTSSTIAGAAVDLGTGGQFNLWIGTVGSVIDVIVDVVGYYTATPGAGAAFTPASARIYDSRVAPEVALAAGESRTVPVGGTADVPFLAGTRAYAVSAQIVHAGSSAGYLTTAPGDGSAVAVAAVFFSAGSDVRSDLVVAPAGADGTVTLTNVSSDPIDVILDVEGWFSVPTPAQPTVTSSSFTDGESGVPADANATFSFSAPAGPGQTTAVRFRYALDDATPTLVDGSSPTVPLGLTVDGPHYLLVSAIDANGGESDFTNFFFYVGDPAAASAEVDNDMVQASVASQITTTEADGTTTVTQPGTESHNLTAAAPQQLPGSGGGPPIGRLSCRVSNHHEVFAAATLDMRYLCATRRANFNIQLTPPPPGSTTVSYVYESGFQWYLNGRRKSDTSWHDEPIWYNFHGTFNPVTNQSYVFGSDQLAYSYMRGRQIVMVQVTVRVQFIAVP